MITLTASGSVSDYSDNDKSSLQQKVASAAGVGKSLVTISVAAASVLITATIAVPASMNVDDMQTSLSSSLGTADAASAALGVTVEGVPIIDVESSIAPDSSSDDNNMALIIGMLLAALLLVALLTCAIVLRRRKQRKKWGRVNHREGINLTAPGPVSGLPLNFTERDDLKVNTDFRV